MENLNVVGKSVPRPDGAEKVTGEALYAVDLAMPGMLYGKILRSPFAHARILNIDTSRAEALPGVKAVVTARDVPRVERKLRAFFAEGRLFATDRVRFVGDEVAAVAATHEEIALEALEQIQVDYELLPSVLSPEQALLPEAPRLHSGQDNIAAQFQVTRGYPESAFSQADAVFQHRVETQIQHQSYLEPVGCLARYDAGGKLTLWVSHMDPSGVQMGVAQLLNLPESRVRIIQAHCGGAFGGKITVYPLYPICGLLSMKTGQPVKMVNDREEESISACPRVPAMIEIKLAVKKDGTLLAKETHILADNGAYMDLGPRVVAQMIVAPDGIYRVPNIKAEAKVVYTNRAPVGAFRGFGQPQILFALEQLMDEAAGWLKMDPKEFRLRHAAQPGEVSVHGWEFTSCGLKECIQEATKAAEWERVRRENPDFVGTGQGLGLGCALYYSTTRRWEAFAGSVAYVTIKEDGRARVISGEAEYGQGWNTSACQVAAEELGLPYSDVEVTTPDTDYTPYAMGPWGLRVTISGINAVRLAARDARRQLTELAAEMLEASPQDLVMAQGRIFVKGAPEKGLALSQVARHAIFRKEGSAIMGKGVDEPDTRPLDPHTLYGNISPAYVFAAQAASVKVDRETGAARIARLHSAHDIGRAISPIAAEGQVEGSFATGLGLTLMEGLVWDEEKIMNPNFLDYRLPTALDMPEVETILVETKDPGTPYGAKSIGQLATMAATGTLANAIAQAVGAKLARLPLTPPEILKALEEKISRL